MAGHETLRARVLQPQASTQLDHGEATQAQAAVGGAAQASSSGGRALEQPASPLVAGHHTRRRFAPPPPQGSRDALHSPQGSALHGHSPATAPQTSRSMGRALCAQSRSTPLLQLICRARVPWPQASLQGPQAPATQAQSESA